MQIDLKEQAVRGCHDLANDFLQYKFNNNISVKTVLDPFQCTFASFCAEYAVFEYFGRRLRWDTFYNIRNNVPYNSRKWRFDLAGAIDVRQTKRMGPTYNIKQKDEGITVVVVGNPIESNMFKIVGWGYAETLKTKGEFCQGINGATNYFKVPVSELNDIKSEAWPIQ